MEVQLIHDVVVISAAQQGDSGTHTHTHTHILFHILFHYSLSQSIEYSSLSIQ